MALVLSSQEGPVATITINRPEVSNTLTHELVLNLTETIKEVSAKEGIRLVILTAAGDRAFVGGVDVREFTDLTPDAAERFITDLHLCFLEIRRSEKIFIASINGAVLGGGLEMVTACELRIAADHARFGMPEVKVGLPSVIEAAYLPRLIGLGRAAEMVYLGEMIDAREAERIGLVNKIVPREKLKEATHQMAEILLANGPKALVLQKKLVAQWMEMHLSAAVEAGIKSFREVFKTGEPREGAKAFLEKRKPSFAVKWGK